MKNKPIINENNETNKDQSEELGFSNVTTRGTSDAIWASTFIVVSQYLLYLKKLKVLANETRKRKRE